MCGGDGEGWAYHSEFGGIYVLIISQTKFLQGRECLRCPGFLQSLSKSRYLIINRILGLKRAFKVISFKPHFTDGGMSTSQNPLNHGPNILSGSLGF